MGSGTSVSVQKRYKKGDLVMIDVGARNKRLAYKDFMNTKHTGHVIIGQVTSSCIILDKNNLKNFEYTVLVEDGHTECAEEQYLAWLHINDLEWIGPSTRLIAVGSETHGEQKFAAEVLARTEDGLFEVRFLADNTILTGVSPEHIYPPDDQTIFEHSLKSAAPDPLWLIDRKMYMNIDKHWPLRSRIKDAAIQLRTPRLATVEVLRGPFIGNGMFDSEGFRAHPAPPDELAIDGSFVDTWAKFAGKIKFASTWKIGPNYPRMDDWLDHVDVSQPLYFFAALPVHAGLVCLGLFQGQPEWVRMSDVALMGVALYMDGELVPRFTDPPLDEAGQKEYGHECCNFIPGCVSTYLESASWIGATFCLAPAEKDSEIRDDIYNIRAYHRVIRECATRIHEHGSLLVSAKKQHFTIQVNLVVSTNYLANLRQVCAGAIRVNFNDKGLAIASERMRDIEETRLHSPAAVKPGRSNRKHLSVDPRDPGLDGTAQENSGPVFFSQSGAQQQETQQTLLPSLPDFAHAQAANSQTGRALPLLPFMRELPSLPTNIQGTGGTDLPPPPPPPLPAPAAQPASSRSAASPPPPTRQRPPPSVPAAPAPGPFAAAS